MNDKAHPGGKAGEIVVFMLRRDAQCAECGEQLGSGRRLRVENDKPAEAECLADEEKRARQRERAAVLRAVEDEEFTRDFAEAIRRDFSAARNRRRRVSPPTHA